MFVGSCNKQAQEANGGVLVLFKDALYDQPLDKKLIQKK